MSKTEKTITWTIRIKPSIKKKLKKIAKEHSGIGDAIENLISSADKKEQWGDIEK